MASAIKTDSRGRYVVVEKGDTLSEIAQKHLGSGSAATYKRLAAINNIPNPDLIYIGQKIYLDSSSGTTTSGSSKRDPNITHFGLLANSDNTLYAAWTWSKEKQTKAYAVYWTYLTGDGIQFKGNTSEQSVDKHQPALGRQSTYSIPDNATQVQFKVKPISEEKDSETKSVHWTANWSETKEHNVAETLDAPSAPTVSIDVLKLTASLSNLDPEITHIVFQVVRNDTSVFKTSSKIPVKTTAASFQTPVASGMEYKVRCRAYKNKIESDWSTYSNNESTIPSPPVRGIYRCDAISKTAVHLEWDEVETADSYEIEYTTNRDYFDKSDQTTKKTGIESRIYDLYGLESGYEYFFRVRSTNSKGSSPWSSIKSVTIGSMPSAPTTWSSTTTVMTGEELTLYWIHNTKDNSSQTFAEVEITIGKSTETKIVTNSTDEEEKDKTSFYPVNTSSFNEGTTVKWRVRTAGITNEVGEWSVMRTVEVYAPPSLELTLWDHDNTQVFIVEHYPLYIEALPSPSTQRPIGYHVSIISEDTYETTDAIGNPKTVTEGDSVYSKYYEIDTQLAVELSANNLDLENGMNYTIVCTASMDSGLTAESTLPFTVNWNDVFHAPNAEIGIDPDTLSAYIMPYCEDVHSVYFKVTKSGRVFTKTDATINAIYSDYVLQGVVTTNDIEEDVYQGITDEGEEVYFCITEVKTLVDDVTLSVYRREFDGSFTEIATGINNDRVTSVTDPHPSLDYARYRIVSTLNSTGAINYHDLAGHYVGCKEIIIQWDEEWSYFETSNDDMPVKPPWAGSLLRLPYNIDTSETNSPEVSFIKYTGRTSPVSYYGTQLGETATWNTVIDKKDVETIYALRRLRHWLGNVYVREPSGVGYWANITVQFSQRHLDLTIPVTLNITRVEGGI